MPKYEAGEVSEKIEGEVKEGSKVALLFDFDLKFGLDQMVSGGNHSFSLFGFPDMKVLAIAQILNYSFESTKSIMVRLQTFNITLERIIIQNSLEQIIEELNTFIRDFYEHIKITFDSKRFNTNNSNKYSLQLFKDLCQDVITKVQGQYFEKQRKICEIERTEEEERISYGVTEGAEASENVEKCPDTAVPWLDIVS